MYNAIGSALPMKDDGQRRGKTFYYADLRLGGGRKVYCEYSFTCCAGTYPQAVAEYYNIIWYKDDHCIYLSQFIPSELTTSIQGIPVHLVLKGEYPNVDHFEIKILSDGTFTLKLRVPSWLYPGEGAVRVNGDKVDVALVPGTWTEIGMAWHGGDVVCVEFPMHLRLSPIHTSHPERSALMYGPLMLAAEGRVSEVQGEIGNPAGIAQQSEGLRFVALGVNGHRVIFKPYREFKEQEWYSVYFDLIHN